LQNMRWNVHQRRTTFGDEGWRKFCSASVGQIKCAALGIEDARRSFNNQAMQIRWSNCLAKSLAQSVKEIEDERLFYLNFFLRTLESPNASPLSHQRIDPRGQACDQQPEKNGWPHEIVASLLPRRRLMEVLF